MRKKFIAAVLAGFSVAAAFGILAAGAAARTTVQFTSGSDWTAFSVDPGTTPFLETPAVLGPAQRVCMSQIAPPSCAPGATVYHSPFFGWTADLSPIPGAAWIWRPGINGDSTPADLSDNFFSKTVILDGEPTGGTIYVAVDDFAAVRVNGQLIGTLGSIVSAGLAGKHTYLTAFDLGWLHPGRNVVTVEAQNGPWYFSGLCNPCNYALNPAGVVFGGSVSFDAPAPHEQYGGLGLHEYCQALGYADVVQTKPRFGFAAAIDNWRCAEADGSLHPFSMEQACKWEYGLDAIQVHFLDRDDAFSWKCFAV